MKTPAKTLTSNVAHLLLPVLYFSLLALVSLLAGGCNDTCLDERTYIEYEPKYMSLEELRSSIKTSATREIVNPGKMYFLNGYMLINQPGEGIHVIDNRDVNSPSSVSFIEAPGNFDLAGTGQYLFIDSYVDLVVLDLSDMNNVSEVKRVENFFPNYSSFGFGLDTEKGVVTEWVETETTEKFKGGCDTFMDPWMMSSRGGVMVDATFTNRQVNTMAVGIESASFSSQGPSTGAGIGGSLARFTVTGNHLYALDDTDMHTVDISNPEQPVLETKKNVGWGIETIFPYGDKLFIGSQTGMHIYSLSNPASPEHLSTYSHVMSCDPVVVEGDYAYVTLRSGNTCRQGVNLLEVIDIADATRPQLVSSYDMYSPGGLGIDNNVLFVCDGNAGLKIFDATDKFSITQNQLAVYPDMRAIDVIPFNNILMVIAEDGFYQYDYSDINNIVLLSDIPVTRDY